MSSKLRTPRLTEWLLVQVQRLEPICCSSIEASFTNGFRHGYGGTDSRSITKKPYWSTAKQFEMLTATKNLIHTYSCEKDNASRSL